MSNVLRIDHSGWVELRLNRPDARNALSGELLHELLEHLQAADDDSSVHAMLITGEGRDFCAGYDLKGKADDSYGSHSVTDGGFDADLARVQKSAQPIMDVLKIRKPVVAMVHGFCLAGGTDLAFVCDIVIAADDAMIGFPATRDLGSPPVPMWLYHVGPQWAKRLLLTGDSISGQDAAKIGLVLKSVPREALEDEVHGLMRRMSAIDPHLLTANKRIVQFGLELPRCQQCLEPGPRERCSCASRAVGVGAQGVGAR
ncbi:enoyl-CoA hydratase-related protein [Aeromicrobium sp. UC242_57]|uniref:enoyl-CoA hydratase-related protein n=1 Tax=Aeromicrobium sp. UC242_57 TaxID=3374624 RepID=UPI0037ADB798